jgi:hypothetical protein
MTDKPLPESSPDAPKWLVVAVVLLLMWMSYSCGFERGVTREMLEQTQRMLKAK